MLTIAGGILLVIFAPALFMFALAMLTLPFRMLIAILDGIAELAEAVWRGTWKLPRLPQLPPWRAVLRAVLFVAKGVGMAILVTLPFVAAAVYLSLP